MPDEAVVTIENINHFYGEGELRKQILFDVSAEIRPGEIVILTGPSGGGKTTLLTLVGGLRSVQQGSLTVLGRELNGAREETLVSVRKKIGYIFQAHNLLDALTALQNVEMAALLETDLPRQQVRGKSLEMLRAVGLADWAHKHPSELSGGQKQRVAIARALVRDPKLILADEPTASLDKKSGRDVVEIMDRLAQDHGCTVLLVTHDNRILDTADRIIHLEDGRLTSFTDAVAANTQHMLTMLAQQNRKGELLRRVRDLPVARFATLLEQVTSEFQQLLHITDISSNEAFETMLDQVLEAFTFKVGEILQADRATLFLVDEDRGQLWSKVAQGGGEKPLEIRIPVGTGIAGHVAATGVMRNIPDAYEEPLFNRDVDRRTGYRTRSILCVPIVDSRKRVFAVAQLLNKQGGLPFDPADEQHFAEFATSIGVILESWWRMCKGHLAARSNGQ